MIEFTKGDLFSVCVDIRVNTVNCVGVMGTGVALVFRERYPGMFTDYKKACKEGRIKPGKLHVWRNLTGDWIVNFPTKMDWRDFSEYEYVESGLIALRDYLSGLGNVTVALPAIGCGHGGLDWKIVSKLVARYLADIEAKVLVFEPDDSRRAGKSTSVLSEESQTALRQLGFETFLSRANHGGARKGALLVWGNPEVSEQQWIAVLPSKEPTEPEKTGLDAIASQLSLSPRRQTISLIYNNRSSEDVAKIFLRHGLTTVLILPFGPLSRPKLLDDFERDVDISRLVILTASEAHSSWSLKNLNDSNVLLRSQASRALLSDPVPTWFNSKVAGTWRNAKIFFFGTSNLPAAIRTILEEIGANPIRRKPSSRIPDVDGLILSSDDLNYL